LLWCVFSCTQAECQPVLSNLSGSEAELNSTTSVYFIENKGQVHNEFDQPRPDVIAVGVSAASQLLIKTSGYSHQLNRVHYRKTDGGSTDIDPEPRQIDSVLFSRVDLNWVGAKTDVVTEKLDQRIKVNNFYNLPHCPEGITGVKEYASVRLANVYPGIDVRFYDAGGLFEHDYELAPGADYRDIRIEISGTEAGLNSSGELEMPTPLGTITESSPIVFQNGKELLSRWIEIDNNVWGFEIPDANPELAMIIDPVSRVWGTYYGGTSMDEILFIKADQEGNLYSVGGTQSTTNIATVGTQQVVLSAGLDAFLTKFDEDGNQIWGTYIGGNGNESAWGCDIDADGNIIVIGRTESTNNISTPGAHQVVQGDGGTNFDGMVIKFDANGIREWGTYYGGLFDDRARYVHIGTDGFIYVAGATTSENAIATPGSHQEEYLDGTNDFGNDGFLVKFTPEGVRLWATYYGGLLRDQGYSVATDSNLDLYMWGHTQSSTSIATPGAFQTIHGGGEWDTFLVKFTPDGVRIWGTYIGGSNDELAWTCSMDETDHIYLTGRTNSPNAMATPGTHQQTLGGNMDAFLLKFNSLGDKVWGTYLGGNQADRGYGCSTIPGGGILVAGFTASATGMATPLVHQETIGGGTDAFLALFDGEGGLDWCTYYGGSSAEIGHSATYFDGAFYLAGRTQSNNNISTAGIHQENFGGGQSDGFIVKFADCVNSSSEIEIASCDPYEAPDGMIYDESGTYTAVIPNAANCDSIITIILSVTDYPETNQFLSVCESESILLPDGTTITEDGVYTLTYETQSGCDSIINYEVSFNSEYNTVVDVVQCNDTELFDHQGNQIVEDGTYILEYQSYYGCDSIVQWNVSFVDEINITLDSVICAGDVINTPNGNIWQTGEYTLVYISANGCDSIVHLNLVVNPLPTAAFSTSPTSPAYTFDNPIHFNNESLNADSLFWNFFDFGTSTQENPVIDFGQTPGVFDVCLTAYSAEGCAHQWCEQFTIKGEFAVYIPNSFTPNGDGINDLFFVEGVGIDPNDFLMRVFNRYGEIIFETNDLYKKWDGAERARTHYAQNEVYVYQVFVGALHSTEKKELNGRVTVIR